LTLARAPANAASNTARSRARESRPRRIDGQGGYSRARGCIRERARDPHPRLDSRRLRPGDGRCIDRQARAGPPAASPAPALRTGKRKKGQKRSPAELQRIEETLAAFIQKTPGKRIEEINKALGTSTSDLSRPLSKLIAAKKVRRQGQKRASRYFPTGK
jgi:hypothetical protein